MTGQVAPFAVYPGGQPGRTDTPPGREYHELWFQLAQHGWASVVLVPAGRAAKSVSSVAMALADAGSRIWGSPVSAIIAESMDYLSTRVLAGLQPRAEGRASAPWPRAVGIDAKVVEREAQVAGAPGASSVRHDAVLMPPAGRAIIAIHPVVEEPLGIAIAHGADAVVLCVEPGITRMKEARRTIELIGRSRIVGVFLVR